MDEQKHLQIFDGGFTKFPAFFVKDLMPLAEGIPASFWKYMLVVWVDIMDYRPGFKCYKTMKQFPLTKSAAMKWTAALEMSCLFNVHYGKKHNLAAPGTPTLIEYRPNSAQQDWVCFINALRETVLEDRDDGYGDIEGFRIVLAGHVRVERAKNGLSTQEVEARIAQWTKDGLIKDGRLALRRKGTDHSGLLTPEVHTYLQEQTGESRGAPEGTF